MPPPSRPAVLMLLPSLWWSPTLPATPDARVTVARERIQPGQVLVRQMQPSAESGREAGELYCSRRRPPPPPASRNFTLRCLPRACFNIGCTLQAPSSQIRILPHNAIQPPRLPLAPDPPPPPVRAARGTHSALCPACQCLVCKGGKACTNVEVRQCLASGVNPLAASTAPQQAKQAVGWWLRA